MLKTHAHKLLIFPLLLLWSICHAEWELVKQESNVKLFRSSLESEQFSSRIETEMNTPFNTVVNIVTAIDACSQWIYRCQTAHRISRTDDNTSYLYYVRNYPFPMESRHGVIQIKTRYQADDHFLMMFDLRKDMTPEDVNFIIPETFSAKIWVRKITPTTTKVSLEHSLNPGGEIPDWLKATIHEDFPFNSILGLIESAKTHRLLENPTKAFSPL